MRSRNIKPGFFKNELLAELPAFDRLLFAGLWMLADREGRLEDRPKRIKIELFPSDTIDVDACLRRLEASEFIERYVACSVKVIFVKHFVTHQSPHGTEKDSALPDKNGLLRVNERTKTGCVTGVPKNIPFEKQSLNLNFNVIPPLPNVIPPLPNVISPCHNALIPDSLIPDSKDLRAAAQDFNGSGHTMTGQQQHKPEQDTDTVNPPTEKFSPDAGNKPEPVKPGFMADMGTADFARLVAKQHATAFGLPRPIPVGIGIGTTITMRAASYEPAQKSSWWLAYFEWCADDAFLSGKKNPKFRADLPYLLREDTFAGVINASQNAH